MSDDPVDRRIYYEKTEKILEDSGKWKIKHNNETKKKKAQPTKKRREEENFTDAPECRYGMEKQRKACGKSKL